MTNNRKSDRGFLNFNHPKDVGLGYYDHLKFTWLESIRSLKATFVMFVHGIFPPLFDLWYSEHIRKAQERIDNVGIDDKN